MTTETITLSSFLLARLEEDQAAAEAAQAAANEGGHWWVDGPARETGKWWVYATGEKFDAEATAAHIARHDPARVLAECAAKRAIVELHAAYPTLQVMVYGTITACSECGSVDDSPVEWPCPTLRTLGAVYADAPQFREEWRP